MKAKKLDRRHSGYSMFKWAIDFSHKENLEFCQIREWLWEQFGPSCELEFCYKFNKNVYLMRNIIQLYNKYRIFTIIIHKLGYSQMILFKKTKKPIILHLGIHGLGGNILNRSEI